MEMRLRAPVTRGYFFLLGALRLVSAASPRNIDQKKISSGTQGNSCVTGVTIFRSALLLLWAPAILYCKKDSVMLNEKVAPQVATIFKILFKQQRQHISKYYQDT